MFVGCFWKRGNAAIRCPRRAESYRIALRKDTLKRTRSHTQNQFTTDTLTWSVQCEGLPEDEISDSTNCESDTQTRLHISIWKIFKWNLCVVEVCVCVCVRAHPPLPSSSMDGVHLCVCVCVWVSVTHSPFVHKIMRSSYRVHLLRIQRLHIFQPFSTLHAGQIKYSEGGFFFF